MGRHVTGDFEYKFWFAVQPSADITAFGGSEVRGQLRWCWNKEDLPTIRRELRALGGDILRETGKPVKHWKTLIQQKGYLWSSSDPSTDTVAWRSMLPLIAKWELGKVIEKTVREKGEVYVEAEL